MPSMKGLQEKISGVFYHHGLFCASHPFAIISLVILVAMFLCYPLLNITPPGNAPLEHKTPLQHYTGPPPTTEGSSQEEEKLNRPRWFYGPPVAYVQQVVVKAAVAPWDNRKLIQIDAFRAPLAKTFEVLQHLQNFQYRDGDKSYSLTDLCMRVSEMLREKNLRGLLPEYNCLLTSPANFWAQDNARFQADGEILKSVYQNYNQGMDAPPSLRDILFGIPWKDVGISRLYFRNRQRIISYAFTIVYKEYNPGFVRALQDHLHHLYPVSASNNNSDHMDIVHYHYRDINYIVEYTPLLVTYVVLFLYLYFSVRKIEMVKSKWGLALSAVVSVIASLLISVAVCLTFGLTPSLNGSEIFPYLVVIIGLENVLVVTRSVVSTPHHLDVKFRVAQGLSKEGWYIFKNLMTELFIVIVGFFTFVPAIQEFCLFALVGLWTDFFLQMFFFTTVLSVDIRRMELSDLQNHPLHPSIVKDQTTPASCSPTGPGVCPIMTHLEMTPPPGAEPCPVSMLPPLTTMGGIDGLEETRAWGWRTDRTPRRVKLLNFWASTRMVQRGLMVCVVVWISILVYKSGLVDHLTHLNATLEDLNAVHSTSTSFDKLLGPKEPEGPDDNGDAGGATDQAEDVAVETMIHAPLPQLNHEDGELWEKLTHNHWPTVFGIYNISLMGKYISILPTIPVSIVIPPKEVISIRHPKETKTAKLQREMHWAQRAANPQGNFDIVLSVLLAVASLILLAYILMVLWKCLCPRRYHKWRPNWGRKGKHRKGAMYYKQIRESVPLLLQGHTQTIDCVVTDGPWVISSCLGGQIRVWDSLTGENVTTIERSWLTPPVKMTRGPIAGRNISDSDADLYAEFHGDLLNSSPLSDFDCTDEYMSLRGSESDISGPGSSRSSRSSSFITLPTAGVNIPQTSTVPRHRVRQHMRHKSADIYMENFTPDLSETINTNFGSLDAERKTKSVADFSDSLAQNNSADGATADADGPLSTSVPSTGYDFTSHFGEVYVRHRESVEERRRYVASQQYRLQEQRLWQQQWRDEEAARKRSNSSSEGLNGIDLGPDGSSTPAVWCLDCRDNLIVVGCGNGRIEFWDGMTGQLKCMYHASRDPVTAVCFTGNKVICARLSGNIDFLELETFVNFNSSGGNMPSPKLTQRSPSSLFSQGGAGDMKSWDDIIHCTLLNTAHAHQQPINLLQYAGGRVISASQDHTLKVYRLEDTLCLFTLHGHHGGITALHLDKMAPLAAASGAEDGGVRMWDLLTGSCVHKLAGHTETVTSLTCTNEYIISSGVDDRLCVWDRCKGSLLHWIQMESGVCNCLGMLTSNLMITGGQGCLYLWDMSKGDVLRAISLGDHDGSVFIHDVHVINNSIVVCDYDSELRVVHFPAVLEKTE